MGHGRRVGAGALSALLVGLLAALAGGASAPAATPDPNLDPPSGSAAGDVIPGRYIVVYKNSVDAVSTASEKLESKLGFARKHTYRHSIKGFAAKLNPGQVAALDADPRVDLIEPDRVVEATAPELPLAAGEPVPPPGVRRIGAATTNMVNGPGANVAVLDTGIQLDHPDLNATAGTNCVTPGASPTDSNGHGTHVAGTIGAKNNGAGVTGVAPGTLTYAVKVLEQGLGANSQIICGVDWVTANQETAGIEVANMSLGSDGGVAGLNLTCAQAATHPSVSALRKAICRSTAAGVRYVVAAGNDRRSLESKSPSAFPEVLTVTAMADYDGLQGGAAALEPSSPCRDTADDSPASFSNWANSEGGKSHTIAAPGACINSTWPTSTYRSISGTSMASPHVAGLVALCVSEGGDPGVCAAKTPAQTINLFRAEAQSYSALNPGYGFLRDPDHDPTAGRYYGHLARPVEHDTLFVTNTNDSGPGSLRAAIVAANGESAWILADNVNGVIELQSALPALSGDDVTIVGPGADNLTVRRAGAGTHSVFSVAGGANVTVSGLKVTGGDSGSGAGGFDNTGELTLNQVSVVANSGVAGGIFNRAGAKLTVRRSTISGNDGIVGGVLSEGELEIENSTIAENSAMTVGGVRAVSDALIENSTIARNTGGPGVAANLAGSNQTSVWSTIVAEPVGPGGNCTGAMVSVGFNLDSGSSCGFVTPADRPNSNPALGPLTDNGGPTQTLAPAANSPALDSGRAKTGMKIDQRGELRPRNLTGIPNAMGSDATDIGALELALTDVVTHTGDSGRGSLRQAIIEAAQTPGPELVGFAPEVAGSIELQSPLPGLPNGLEIAGPGAGKVTVRPASGQSFRVFSVPLGSTVLVTGLQISGGTASTGGGIFSDGVLELRGVEVSSNSATGTGGGIASSGSLTVSRSAVVDNTAGSGGAGIDSGGHLELGNMTVASNGLVGPGDAAGSGGVRTGDFATIRATTIAANSNPGPGGAQNLRGTAILKSTILSDAPSGLPNCIGLTLSEGFNLDSGNSCGLGQPTDITATDPQLRDPIRNGAATTAMLPEQDSPVIDQGSSSGAATDQRGEPRVIDRPPANAAGGDGADIGAVELRPPLGVTNTDDSGPGSLRQGMLDANSTPGTDEITVEPSLSGTINLASPLPTLTGSVNIDGPGAGQLTVRRDAAPQFRILTVAFGASVKIEGLTITNGLTSAGVAGGGINNDGSLLLQDVVVDANTAGLYGGGILNNSGRSLTLLRVTLTSNTAQQGGGIQNYGSLSLDQVTVALNKSFEKGGGLVNNAGGNATIKNSTFSDNGPQGPAPLVAGAIFNDGTLTLGNSTLARNSSTGLTAAIHAKGPTTISDTTIAANSSPSVSGAANVVSEGLVFLASSIIADPAGGAPNCKAVGTGSISSDGFNLESADDCVLRGQSDLVDTDPQLIPLAGNGGPTETMALAKTSPAIDGARSSAQVDQRNMERPVDQQGVFGAPDGDSSDIGAFELESFAKLTVHKQGSGTVTSAAAGIDCGVDCEELLDTGTAVTLTALPGPGGDAARWSGCDAVGAANECVMTVGPEDRDVSANFLPTPPPSQTLPPTTGQTVPGTTKKKCKKGRKLKKGKCVKKKKKKK